MNFDPTIPQELPDHPPLTPKAAAQFQAAADSAAAGRPIIDPHANCIPLGMPRLMSMPFLMEILPAADKVTVIGEEQSQVRRIWTDGCGVTDDVYPSYNGYSYGHWQGSTLIARTVQMRADVPINSKGLMRSDNLVVDERFWLTDHDTLKLEMTLTDPETFAKPWVVVKTFRRTHDALHEYVCEENNRHGFEPPAVTGARP